MYHVYKSRVLFCLKMSREDVSCLIAELKVESSTIREVIQSTDRVGPFYQCPVGAVRVWRGCRWVMRGGEAVNVSELLNIHGG